MWRGQLASIYIAESAAEPMKSLPEVRAIAGRGLEGDRYYSKTGTWSSGRLVAQVTLIEVETIETLNRDHGIEFGLGDSRRNIVTRGVPLTHLVGREFRIGDVRFRGVRFVEPCDHLAKLTDRRILSAMIHRGGLKAEILNDGVIRVDDVIEEA